MVFSVTLSMVKSFSGGICAFEGSILNVATMPLSRGALTVLYSN